MLGMGHGHSAPNYVSIAIKSLIMLSLDLEVKFSLFCTEGRDREKIFLWDFPLMNHKIFHNYCCHLKRKIPFLKGNIIIII